MQVSVSTEPEKNSQKEQARSCTFLRKALLELPRNSYIPRLLENLKKFFAAKPQKQKLIQQMRPRIS